MHLEIRQSLWWTVSKKHLEVKASLLQAVGAFEGLHNEAPRVQVVNPSIRQSRTSTTSGFPLKGDFHSPPEWQRLPDYWNLDRSHGQRARIKESW